MTGKVRIVGAGSPGITSCQVPRARGIPYDCFEAGFQIGGTSASLVVAVGVGRRRCADTGLDPGGLHGRGEVVDVV
jgi:hypothetical protein